MESSMTRGKAGVVFVLLIAAMLIAGLASGCAANESSSDQEPGTTTDSESGPQGNDTGGSETRPAGELPEGATHSITDVLDSPSDGAEVLLVGEIVEMLDGENFTLRDSTGEVYVDGDDDFGDLAAGDTVSVAGTVKTEDSPTRVEIEATAIERR